MSGGSIFRGIILRKVYVEGLYIIKLVYAEKGLSLGKMILRVVHDQKC